MLIEKKLTMNRSVSSNFGARSVSRSSRPPQDLGPMAALIPGWTLVDMDRLKRGLSPSPMTTMVSARPSSYIDQGQGRSRMDQYQMQRLTPTSKSQNLREAFLREPSPTPAFYSARTPTSPGAILPSHRYAGVERLANRQSIYDHPLNNGYSLMTTSPNDGFVNDDAVGLNSERKLFFANREGGYKPSPVTGKTMDSPSYAATSVTSSATSGAPATKDYKEYIRGREIGLPRGDELVNGREKRSGSLVRDSEATVGFSDLPNQIHRKTVKKGFEFTLMVVGESGLGKSTLINSMFLTDIYSDEYPGPSQRATKTVDVTATKVTLKEKNVNLLLTVVDTPGFGFSVDNSNCWKPVVDYIEKRYEEYLNAETKLHRTHIPDNRAHCCLYFIQASGHSLKPIDIEFMLNLHDKVNIIPIIAKADTLTPEECATFKKNVMNEINLHKIKIYEFPECDDDEENKVQKQLKARIPFAVVGSNYVVETSSGDRKRGRKYPWGIVEVENLDHCDFLALRNLLIRNYMLDLLDTTNNVHYENYRCRKLSGIGENRKLPHNAKESNKNPLAQMEEEKIEHEQKMKKLEREMEQVFEMKVNEKMQKLKDNESDLARRHEQMNKALEQERQELEERRNSYEKEKAAFDLVSRDMEEYRRASTLEGSREELTKKDSSGSKLSLASIRKVKKSTSLKLKQWKNSD
ncbi:Septin-7 [Halotydeus destructor]|nr:Septin-7 [Halotydeus destructor]